MCEQKAIVLREKGIREMRTEKRERLKGHEKKWEREGEMMQG